MSIEINKEEIEFSDLSTFDEAGKVFFWNDRVFRAIKPEATEAVRELFSSGLIDELIVQGIFPKTWISDYYLAGYGFVVEHERCFPVTYPYEWSFSMLQDAALTVLKVNSIARKFCYQTMDCHGFNIVFDGTNPKFVDLGSFVKVDPDFKGWLAYDEFLRFFYYPLRLWQSGNSYLANRMLFGGMNMPHVSYFFYKYPFLRMFSPVLVENFAILFLKLKTFSVRYSTTTVDGFVLNLVLSLAKKRLLPFMRADLEAWIQKIGKLSLKKYKTMWGGYHDEFRNQGDILSTPRFDRVVSIVKELSPDSVLELAGNQGVVSMLLLDKLPGIPIICTDYDEIAVDVMYRTAREREIRLSAVMLDFVYPVFIPFSGKSPFERFRAEVVLALAVTHHLLLSGRIKIEHLLRTISAYSKKYVLIEFMPLGLFDGTNSPPVPDWYNVDWFRNSFEKQFNLIFEEKLEDNRILFFGIIRDDTNLIQ